MKSILTEELQRKIENGEKVNLIDVREDAEVAGGKVPQAQHIPLGEIPDSLAKLNKKEHYYIVCHAGGRSSRACEFLIEKGYDVTNVNGGMLAWQGKIE